MIINDKQIYEHLNQWWESNKDLISFNNTKVEKTADMFKRLMSEKSNSTKTIDEQFSMLTDIAYGFAINENENATFNHYADNKHLNYFDVFLEEGERSNITEALNKANIPTDVLKGIKKNIPYDANTRTEDGRLVRVVQETEPPSNTISYFAIYVDGEMIYSWDRSSGGYDDVPYNWLDDFGDYDYEDKVKITYSVSEAQKKTKSEYVQTYDFGGDDIVHERHTKSGRTIYQDSKGRFVSNPNKRF